MSYILHICSWFPHEEDPQNGVFIRQHIELTQDSFLPVVVSNTPKNAKHIAPKSFEVLNLRLYNSKWAKIRVAKRFFKQLLTKKGRPKAIHLHVVSPLGILALLAEKIFKAPIIITEHWTGYRTGLYLQSSPLQKIISKKLFQRAKNILVVSKSLKADILTLGLATEDKIKITPNPIILSQETIIKRQLRKPGINMLSVADFNEKNKNFRGILQAFEMVGKELPELNWTIIGDGPDREHFEILLSDSPVKSRVHLLGRQPQAFVHQHYSEFDFLVSFSRFETFAMVPAEGISAGIPVIAASSGGPEYYINNNNGILVESENIKQLQNAMITMTQSFGSYTTEKLKKSLPQAFNPSTFAQTLTNLYLKD